jgi:hypothetical protein
MGNKTIQFSKDLLPDHFENNEINLEVRDLGIKYAEFLLNDETVQSYLLDLTDNWDAETLNTCLRSEMPQIILKKMDGCNGHCENKRGVRYINVKPGFLLVDPNAKKNKIYFYAFLFGRVVFYETCHWLVRRSLDSTPTKCYSSRHERNEAGGYMEDKIYGGAFAVGPDYVLLWNGFYVNETWAIDMIDELINETLVIQNLYKPNLVKNTHKKKDKTEGDTQNEVNDCYQEGEYLFEDIDLELCGYELERGFPTTMKVCVGYVGDDYSFVEK